MRIGEPARRPRVTVGALLEVGVLDMDGNDPVVIHAMPLRLPFYRFLG